MSIRLSHTAKEKYLLSPRAYYYHYHLNLREQILGSALFFGSLIEVGLEVLFSGGTLEQALNAFRKSFKTYNINGKTETLSSSNNIRYSKSDLDLTIFTDKELKDLENKSQQFKSWASLQRKGELLIEAYSVDIMPKIKKILATQKFFSVKNSVGDEIIGYADMICEWEDGRIIVPDHKTSSMSVKEIAKNESYLKQTAIQYDALKEEFKIDATGLIVLEKNIRKRDPKARVSEVIIVPTVEFIDETYEEYDDVLQNIKQANFPCLSPKCDVYGQTCCFKKYCESNGTDMTGLVKVGKK